MILILLKNSLISVEKYSSDILDTELQENLILALATRICDVVTGLLEL